MNYPIIFGVLGIICLLLATVRLIYQNWGEKVYAPLLSLLFVGVLTTFITVYLTLKEYKEESVFLASIVFNEKSKAVEEFAEQAQTSSAARRQLLYSRLSKMEGGKVDLSNIHEEKELIIYLQELIQYRIITTILRNQTQNTLFIGNPEGPFRQINVPYKLTETDKLSADDVQRIVSGNRFAKHINSDGDTINLPIPIPTDCSIVLAQEMNEDAGVLMHTITIKKANFFRIRIFVQRTGGMVASSGVIPGIDLKGANPDDFKTYTYDVYMRSNFEKWTSGNWRTEEYKEWTKRMFAEIKSELADMPPS